MRRDRSVRTPLPVRAWLPIGLAVGLVAATTRASGPLDELSATHRVCASGPASAIARAERLRGAAAVVAADLLPNPALVIEHQRSLGGPTDRETVVGLAVPLGIGGRRFLLQDAAAARSEQAAFEADASSFEAALAFREAYVTAALDAARVEILVEQQSALDALGAAIGGLAKGGEAAGYDLLRQQNHARMHRRLVASAKARAAASKALLEAWTGEPVALDGTRLADLAGGTRPAAAAPGLSPSAHPRVLGADADARASDLDARAARRRWVPDIEVFAGYRGVTAGQDTGHGFSAALTVPLTFFDHGQGEAARAQADLEVARATAGGLRRGLSAQLKAARLRLELLEASVAEAEAASRDAAVLQTKAKRLYAAGEVTITELLEASRSAEEAKLAGIEAAQEVAGARLALMRAAGTLLDAQLDAACRLGAGGSR